VNASLQAFFAEMESLLMGRQTALEAEQALGPSPSGTQNFAFYRTLIDRNYHKTLRLLFPSIKVLAQRTREGLWTELVRGFVAAHPPRGCRDPNRLGATFSEYLAEVREAKSELPQILEELAEYHWIDYVARTSTNIADDDDGFERRLFIRQFSYPIPAFMRAVTADDAAEVPEPQPMLVVLYRSAVNGLVRITQPTAAGLAALAKRQALPLPPALAELDEAHVALADTKFVEMGVLTQQSTEPGAED